MDNFSKNSKFITLSLEIYNHLRESELELSILQSTVQVNNSTSVEIVKLLDRITKKMNEKRVILEL